MYKGRKQLPKTESIASLLYLKWLDNGDKLNELLLLLIHIPLGLVELVFERLLYAS